MPAAVLDLDRVTKHFDGGRVQAVTDVSLSVAAGETVAVMGASGSGKTTLLNIATGLDTPGSGRVRVDGVEVAAPRQWTTLRRHRIGMVFQAFHLLGALTARENVEMPLLGAGVPAASRRSRALACLDRVGLSDRADHRPAALSGGERQRVAIARAIVTAPGLLVADEPTGSLDSRTAVRIMTLLEDLTRAAGASLLVVTHDGDIAARMDRVIHLVDGRICAPDGAGAGAP